MNISTREKMQVEKDIKKILLDWNYREQTKILVKEYYKGNYSNISIDGYEGFDINGKKGLDLGQYDYYAISSATINDGISEYVNFRVMEDVYRDTIDNTVINIGTKGQNQENLNKIDFLLMHIFDMAYIVERNELLGKEYDEVEKYLCKVLHNAIDFHSYGHISMSKMITNKENYPNIKDYHANNGIDIMQQGIIDVFNQIEPFNTATFNSLLRNKDSALLSRMKKYYSKEYNKILNKILLIGFLFTYYKNEIYFKHQKIDQGIQEKILKAHNYTTTGVVIEGSKSLDNLIECICSAGSLFVNYSSHIYQNIVFEGLGCIANNMNKKYSPTINDIIHAINIDMDIKERS